MDMNDATRLIVDLHQKLADLDHKVAAYRQDMATEFHRYSRQLLQNIPHDISAEVDRAVAATLVNYPALRPSLVPPRHLSDSPPPPPTDDAGFLTESHSNPGDAHHPPPPPSPKSTPLSVLPHASTAALTSPDTAYDRERDRDFHGLFTPSYLPLLDSSHSSPAPAPVSASALAQTKTQTSTPTPTSVSATYSPTLSPASKPTTDDDDDDDDGDDMGRRKPAQPREQQQQQQQQSAASQPSVVVTTQAPDRPIHERRGTNDTTSSGASEQSDSKVRRSALRRASSGSKPPASPRRVRFEFEGGEVLPTTSPQSSEPSLVLSHTLANSRSPPPPEDDSMSVESILGPDEDSGPPPKKVSSSQALRALSRAPLDANTVWTVVNPEAMEKENGSMATSDSETSLQTNDAPNSVLTPQTPPRATASEGKQTPRTSDPEPPVAVNKRRDDNKDEDDDSSSDDEFLAMAKPKSFANKKAILSPLSRSPTRTSSVPYSPTPDKTGPRSESRSFLEQRDADEDEDPDDMFHFEGLSAPPKPRFRPAPIQEEEEEDEDDDDDRAYEPAAPTLYSTSPAVSIPKAPEPTIPAHLISGSVGSFRGRPVTMPVVKSLDVYQQAASLGDVSSFIGGLDGRSGVDDGDLNSYRASVGQSPFSGTPRSLTERMMMEEAQSQRRAAAQRPH
ncbi:hypothetical protein CTA2_11989 [Colletotrichum tanaceti]|nr:hypothetical protein CTA2_11989 [Colletotrichum tanaceti]